MEPKKTTRGAKKFAEKFEKARLELVEAKERNEEEFDAAFVNLAEHMTSSYKECRYFLQNCTDEQFRVVLLVLDDIADEFAGPEFLRDLKALQTRFPQYDLTSSMDLAAIATAERVHEELVLKDSSFRKGVARALDELRDKVVKGDANAMFKLALCYYFGTGTKVDYDAARKWAKKALENGCEEAAIISDLPRR